MYAPGGEMTCGTRQDCHFWPFLAIMKLYICITHDFMVLLPEIRPDWMPHELDRPCITYLAPHLGDDGS